MAGEIFGKGLVLAVEASPGSGTFTPIPRVMSCKGPSQQTNWHNVTAFDTSGNYEEERPGLIKPGSVSGDLSWIPGNPVHDQMVSDQANRTERKYRKTYSNGAYYEFNAAVESWQDDVPVDGYVKVAYSLKLIGGPTALPT